MEDPNPHSPRCLRELPAVMREALLAPGPQPVRELLQAFEDDLDEVARVVRDSHLLFDPDSADAVREFPRTTTASPVPSGGPRPAAEMRRARWTGELAQWLASCVLMEDWIDPADAGDIDADADARLGAGASLAPATRALIGDAPGLYRMRGTPRGLAASVQAICDLEVDVIERSAPSGLRLGVSSAIGLNTWLLEAPDLDRQFTVVLRASDPNRARLPAVFESTTPAAGWLRAVAPLQSESGDDAAPVAWIWGPWRAAGSSDAGAPRLSGRDPGPEAEAARTLAVITQLRSVIAREKPVQTRFHLAAEAPGPTLITGDEPWLRIGLQGEAGFPGAFGPADLRDVPGLVRKLVQRADAVSRLVWEALDRTAQLALENSSTAPARREALLIEGLNRILRGGPIGQARSGRTDRPPLSREAAAILAQPPEGAEVVRFNRRVLETAYPRELIPAPATPTSVIGRFCIK